jgi:hypothetical protein
MKEKKKLDIEISESEEIMESFIKMNREFTSMNIFESIQELQKMLPHECNKLFIELDTKKLMSLSRFKKLIKDEMQKMGIPPLFFKTYSYPKISEIKNGIIKD